MAEENVHELYFEWLCDVVESEDRFMGVLRFKKLLRYLHSREFWFTHPDDENRIGDGKSMRYAFDLRTGFNTYQELQDEAPSVLEVMISLALRAEEQFMSDPEYGNRTAQWFWSMIVSLGLGAEHDERFNEEHVTLVIDRLLSREYDSDGNGGLFTLHDTTTDLRTVGIWEQMCWYLNRILGL